MDYLFFQMMSINGFDAPGPLPARRARDNLCSTYATTPGSGCNANFYDPSAAASAGTSLAPRHATATASPSGSAGQGSVLPGGTLVNGLLGPPADPRSEAERERNLGTLRERARGQSPGLGGRRAGARLPARRRGMSRRAEGRRWPRARCWWAR